MRSDGWQSLETPLKIKVLESLAEMTWENDLVQLTGVKGDKMQENPVLRKVEITEIHAECVNFKEDLPVDKLQYFVKSPARLRQGEMILVESLGHKVISAAKFKEMQANVKVLPLK